MHVDDWRRLMAQPVFRRWLWKHGGTVASFDLRSPLMREAQAVCPVEFVELVREGLQRENSAAALERAEPVPKAGDRSST